MPDYEVAGAPQFVGTRPFKGTVIPPSLWNNTYFPAVKKFMDPSRGAKLSDYLNREYLNTVFLLIFEHKKEKAWRQEWMEIGGKKVFGAWV